MLYYVKDKLNNYSILTAALRKAKSKADSMANRKANSRAKHKAICQTTCQTICLVICMAACYILSGCAEEAANISIPESDIDSQENTIVLIHADDRTGSGVIFQADHEYITIITAAHLIGDTGSVRLTFADGSVCESNNLISSEIADLSFIRVPLQALSKSDEGIRRAAVSKESFDALMVEDKLTVIGYKNGEELCTYIGDILDTWIYMEDFEQYMIWAELVVWPGMSGGGVFDEKGYLAGLLCGSDNNIEAAILPLSLILSEYSRLYG